MCNSISRVQCGLGETCDSYSQTCISGITENRAGKEIFQQKENYDFPHFSYTSLPKNLADCSKDPPHLWKISILLFEYIERGEDIET